MSSINSLNNRNSVSNVPSPTPSVATNVATPVMTPSPPPPVQALVRRTLPSITNTSEPPSNGISTPVTVRTSATGEPIAVIPDTLSPLILKETVGTEGDDVLETGDNSIPTNGEYGYHKIDGKAGNDTLVLNKSFKDYQISIDPENQNLLLHENFTGNDFPARPPMPLLVDNIEKFQFSDITLDKSGLTDPQQKLNYYQKLWETSEPNNYVFNVNRFNINTETTRLPTEPQSARIDVINKQAVNAYAPSENQTLDPDLAKMTIKSIFDLAQQSIAQGQGKDIYYDRYGIPVNVRLGTTQYSTNLESLINLGTTQDDTFNIDLTLDPTNPPKDFISTSYRGEAGNDTAVFNGKLSEFSYYKRPDGSIDINARRFGGNANLKDIETLKFTDITLSAAQLTDPLQTLNYYRNIWNSQGLSNYSIQITKVDTSQPPTPEAMYSSSISSRIVGQDNINLDVIDGQIVNRYSMDNSDVSNSTLANFTVDNLFKLIEQSVQQGKKVQVNYDTYGIPNSISIDNDNYYVNLTAKLIPGTAADDVFTAQEIPMPSAENFTPVLNNRYIGREGNDTLAFSGNLKDYYIYKEPNGNFNIAPKDFTRSVLPTLTSGIETFKFNDVTIDTAQLNNQLVDYYNKQWDQAPLLDYTLQINKSTMPISDEPFSPIPIDPNSYKTATIEVKNGQITSVTATNPYGESSTPDPELAQLTVEKIFDLARSSIANNADETISFSGYNTPENITFKVNNEQVNYNIYLTKPGEENQRAPTGRPIMLRSGSLPAPVGASAQSTSVYSSAPTLSTAPTTLSTPITGVDSEPVAPVTSSSSTEETAPLNLNQELLIAILSTLIELIKALPLGNEGNNDNNSRPHNNGQGIRLGNRRNRQIA